MYICLTVAGSPRATICHKGTPWVMPAITRHLPGRPRKRLSYAKREQTESHELAQMPKRSLSYAKVTKKVENFNYIDYFCKQNYRLWSFVSKL